MLFDAYDCDSERLSNKKFLTELLSKLPKKMGMHTIYEPVVIEVGELNEKDPGGISGFVLIAESHISFHTFPKRRFVTADVYTCQDSLDNATLIKHLSEAFGSTDYDTSIIDRGVRYPDTNLP